MKVLRLISVFVCLVAMTTPAIAQLDPDPNGLGLYADLEGMSNQLLTPPGVVDIHLLATNITLEKINTWAVGVTIDGNAVITAISTPYPNVYGSENPAPNTYFYSFVAYPDDPCTESGLAQAPVIHLATLEIWVSDTDPIDFYLGSISLTEEYLSPSYGMCTGGYPSRISRDFNQSSGDPDLPVMRINGEAPVPAEARSWGRVKAMYR